MNKNGNDHELMMAVKHGDRASFETIVDRHRAHVVNLAYRLTGDRSVAEDIGQEVFLRIYKNAGRFNPRWKFTTYLFRSVRNACIDYFRRKRVDLSIDDSMREIELSDPRQDVAKSVADAETGRFLRLLVDALPEEQRTALILKHYEGRGYKEIADIMGTTISSVKSLLFRGREKLKKMERP